jgi:hypothetical protein
MLLLSTRPRKWFRKSEAMAFNSHYLEDFNLYPGLSTFRCFLDMPATVRDRLPPPRHTFQLREDARQSQADLLAHEEARSFARH